MPRFAMEGRGAPGAKSNIEDVDLPSDPHHANPNRSLVEYASDSAFEPS